MGGAPRQRLGERAGVAGEVRYTSWFVALAGCKNAATVPVEPGDPASRSSAVGSTEIAVTRTTGASAASTVTAHRAAFPPSAVVTVIVAVPSWCATTFTVAPPVVVSVATLASLVVHWTSRSVASAGATVAVSGTVVPSVAPAGAAVRVSAVELRATPVTATGVTCTVAVAETRASSCDVTVTVATPIFMPVKVAVFPLAARLATPPGWMAQVSAGVVALAGATEA